MKLISGAPGLLTVALVCVTTTLSQGTQKCTEPLDVIAVVDGSDSISRDAFKTLKQALINLVDGLNLGENNQRFGVVVYSNGVSEFAPLSSDKATLKSNITAFEHPRKQTDTADGILKMNELMNTGGREKVPRVGIVITDGESYNPAATVAAANASHNLGIKMFAVGVGNLINMNELHSIATSPEYVKNLTDFDALQRSIADLVEKICPTPVDTLCAGCLYINGVGLVRHPRDCTKFYKCYREGTHSPALDCPSGLVFDNDALVCNWPDQVPGCNITEDDDDGAAYCGPQLYLPFTTDAQDHSGHHAHVHNVGVVASTYGRFHSGNALRVLRFSNVDFGTSLTITFKFQPGEVGETTQALVSNADCAVHGSVYITYKPGSVDFTVWNAEGKPYFLSLPCGVTVTSSKADNTWSQVRLTIHDGQMTARVDDHKKQLQFKGRIGKSKCALQVGQATGHDHFVGYIDELRVYMCYPDVFFF